MRGALYRMRQLCLGIYISTYMHVTTTSEEIKDLEFERGQGGAYGLV